MFLSLGAQVVLVLEEALGDTEPSVVLAAANPLLLLHDDVGYDTYYEVLTGEKRANKGLIKEQLDTLKDKTKMAQLGFEEGIRFIPFAGIGYEVFKTVTKTIPRRCALLRSKPWPYAVTRRFFPKSARPSKTRRTWCALRRRPAWRT